MSKAFVREDDGAEAPQLEGAERSLGDGPRYVTPAGFARLVAELERVGREDRRGRFLHALLERITVVHPSPEQAGRVFFGARVTVEDPTGETSTWQIVGPDEADAAEGRISVEAPLARALLGKSEGDEVRVTRPRGDAVMTVVAIEYDGD